MMNSTLFTLCLFTIFACAALATTGEDLNAQLKDILDRGHKMGTYLKDNTIEMSENTRKSMTDTYVAYSEEANRKIAELGSNGKTSANKYLEELQKCVPPAFKSSDEARKEVDSFLTESRNNLAHFGRKVSDGANDAASGVKGAILDGAESMKGFSADMYEKAKRFFNQ